MQKFLRIMLLMAFSALSWAANAQNTLTVANGMSTNGFVPVYGYYADAYLRSQIIYPAADIAAATTTAGMTGGSITSMTFYTSEEEVSLSAVFEVRIKEVPLTTLSYFDSLDGAALVYSGTLNVDDYQMVVTFDSAYTYNGGNLLVDFSTASTGNYVTTTFYGLNATGASVQGYSYGGLSSVNATQRDFMPMTTFTFTGGMAVSCAPVQGLTVGDITPSGATMHILDAINSGATYSISYWKEGGNDTLSVVTADTLYTFTGLDASSLYYYTVTAVCSATDQSIAMGGSFATACGGTTCDISITGTDSYGDGWNGNTLLVMQNGVEVGSFTLYGGSVYSATIPVCSGMPVSFKWLTGNYAYEAAFIIADGGGTTVYTCNNGGDLPSGETFFTLSGACPSCMPVANLSAESTATSVTISWTGSAASYDVYSDSTFVATVTDSSYTFTGLTPLTAYTFGVVANCSADDVSNMTTINTNTGCESGECNIYIYAQDSYGDGWNGNTIDIMQNGIVWASYSMETQNLSSTVIYDTAVVTVCAAMPLSFGWTTGDYAYEASFEIMNALGVNVYSATGSEMSGDGTFLALSSCTGMPEFDTVTVFDTACDYFWWNLSGNSYTESGVYSVQSGTTINILNLTVNHSVVDSLFVTADGGYSWYGDFYNESGVYYHNSIGENGCDYTEYLFLTINSNDSVAVTITVSCDTTMGTVTGGGTYDENSYFTVTAYPNSGYHFVRWNVYDTYGDNLGYVTDNPWTYYAYENYYIEAVFEADPQPIACSGSSCQISIVGYDSYGDGWNGGTLQLMQNNSLIGVMEMEDGSYATQTFEVCNDYPVELVWNAGGWTSEVSFNILSAEGVNLLSVSDASSIVSGRVFARMNTVCTNPTVVEVHDTTYITIANADATMGTTNPAPGTYTYIDNEYISIESEPYSGYKLDYWVIDYYYDGLPYSDTSNSTGFYSNAGDWHELSPVTFTAHFTTLPNYTVTVNYDATMGSVTGAGVYQEGSEFTLTATPNPGYMFESWEFYLADSSYYGNTTSNPFTYYADQDYVIEAVFAVADNINITIAVNDSTMGSTTPASGTYQYTEGDWFYVEAIANSGYRFTGWTVNYWYDSVEYTQTEGDSYLDWYIYSNWSDLQPMTFTANFEPIPTHTITVYANDPTMGTVTGGGVYYENDDFTLTATPNPGYMFDRWEFYTSDSIYYGWTSSNPFTYYADQDYVIEAVFFQPDNIEITISVNDSTMGTTSPAPGTYQYTEGNWFEAQAIANSGYRFSGWTLTYYYDSVMETETFDDDYLSLFIYSNWSELLQMHFTANFEAIPTYTVNVTVDDSTMGSAIGGGVYYEYDEFTLEAYPNAGYMFDRWEFYTSDGNYYGTINQNPFTYYAYEDYNIVAVFSVPDSINVTIAVNDSTLGSTYPAPGTYQHFEGNRFEVEAIPNTGCRFSHWLITYYYAGEYHTETNYSSYLDYYIYSNWSERQNLTFTANFEVIPTYTVTVTVNDSTMGSAIGGGVYYENDYFTLEAYPNAGYMFDRWEFYTADGSYYGYTTSNPFTYYADQNYNIVAVFTVPDTINVTIAVSDSTLGSTYPAPGTYQHVEGNWFEVEAIPNSGYRFSYWLISYYVDGEYQTETDYSSYLDYYIYPNWSELQNMTFTAYFEPLPTYTITAFCDSTMGTVTGSGTYMEGTEFTLTAIPNAGYHFVEWIQYSEYGDYYDSYTSNPLTLNAYGNYYYEAVFEADPQPIACSGTSCFVTVSGYDSYGDGWNGGKLRLIQRDTVVGQMMITDGSFGTQTFELCNDYPVSFWWVGGNWEDEVSFTVTNAAGTTLFSVEDASMVSEDYPLYTFANICTNPTEMHDTVTVIIAVNDSTMGTTYPAPGTYHFLDNEYIDFYPYADSGYVFTGWTASFNFMGQSYVMPMDGSDLGFYAAELLEFSPITFTANFEVYVPVYHTITVVANDSTMGTVTGGGVYEQQESFTIEATPNPGYVFDYWEFYLSDSSYYGWTRYNPFTYTADQDYTIVAVFTTADTVSVTIAVNNAAMGTTSPAPGTYQYVEGDYFYVEAIPDSGYQFTNWTIGYYVDGEYQTETDYSSVINYYIYSNWSELQNLTFTANFEVHVPSYYTITVLANDSTMGTVTGGGTYLENTDFTVTATPNAGYMFEEWDIYDYYGNWYGWASSNPFTYTADQDYYFVAYFAPIDSVNVTIAVNNATMGTTSPAPGTYQYLTGDTFNATATPASGYIFQNWTVTYSYDSTVVSEYISDNPNLEMTVNSFWSEQQNLTFTANFSTPEPVSITVAVNDSTLGTTTPAPGTYTYYTGDTIYLSAEPYGNNFFDHWTVDFYEDGVAESVTLDDYSMGFLVSSLTEPVQLTFTAVFSSTPVGETTDTVVCTFAVNDAALGTTNPAPGTYTYYTGNALHCVAQPNNGCQFDGWSVTLTHDGVTYLDTTYYYPVADFFDLFGGWIVEYGENGYNWNVTAIFSGIVIVEPDSADITLAVNNADWGTTNPATGTYRYAVGETFSATATPAEGYTFVGWTVTRTLDGESVSDTIADNHIELTVGDDDLTVTAIFTVTPVGIDAVDPTDITVYSSEGRIIVLGAEGRKVVLYDVTGRVLNTKANADEKVEFNVPASGVYLVKAGSAPARRVVVVK